MKVTGVYGSPRLKGNSAQLAERFLSASETHGAEVQRFYLNNMTFKGCQGCGVCKDKLDYCVVKDDLTLVLDAVRETDVLVLATPVYYMDVSAQLKAFIDRTYSYLNPDFLSNPESSRLNKGKKMLFIQTQHQGDSLFHDIYDRYSMFFRLYGFNDCTFIQACDVGQDSDIQKRDDLFEKVDQAFSAIIGNSA